MRSHKQLHYVRAKYAGGYGGYALSTNTKMLLVYGKCVMYAEWYASCTALYAAGRKG